MRTLHHTPASPRLLVRILLRAYPAAWRERYGVEVAALLAAQPPGARQLVDLAAGALDARLHPALLVLPAGMVTSAAGPAPRPPASPGYGAVAGTPVGELSRRTFMRRALGAGAGLLALEFVGGTLAFLWPQIREGIGAQFRLGTLDDILRAEPRFAGGWPYAFAPARVFLLNVPAAQAMATGGAIPQAAPTGEQLLALWRKCPHLGCQVPEPCSDLNRFQCRCHGSTFNIMGEKMKAGPAPRGMDRFPVSIDVAGTVIIDTSQRIAGPPARASAALGFDDGHPFEATCFPV
ncbi:MAG: Rieske 2Fe-2S domain-containing protein [Chloroflexota bacterium]